MSRNGEGGEGRTEVDVEGWRRWRGSDRSR